MNLLEWEVGIPGKTGVRKSKGFRELSPWRGALNAWITDTMGRRSIQVDDDIPGRYSFLQGRPCGSMRADYVFRLSVQAPKM